MRTILVICLLLVSTVCYSAQVYVKSDAAIEKKPTSEVVDIDKIVSDNKSNILKTSEFTAENLVEKFADIDDMNIAKQVIDKLLDSKDIVEKEVRYEELYPTIEALEP